MRFAKFEQVLHSSAVFSIRHDRVDPVGDFFVGVAITRHLTTNVTQCRLFKIAPDKDRADLTDGIA